MHISASILNRGEINQVVVTTNDSSRQLNIPSKQDSRGSSVNGGELLFLAIATCYCNDIYREAAKRKLEVRSVEVVVNGEFCGEGEAGSNILYHVKIDSGEPEEKILDLLNYVDQIAEVHNTIRKGTPVTFLMHHS